MKQRDYLKAGAMLAALVTMAPAEYALGQACGFGHLAAGLPASLDIYTLRAIRTGRDVPAVALVMIAVNAASHLIAAGHLAVTWYLIVAVSALPVLVLVRVERLGKGVHSVETPQAELTVPEFVTESDSAAAPPAPEPVTLERADEAPQTAQVPPSWPVLGPLVPVAELLTAPASATPVAPDVAPVALLTVADVAKAMDVAEGTVRSWVKRDKLTPAERDSNGRLLFHPDTVAALGVTP